MQGSAYSTKRPFRAARTAFLTVVALSCSTVAAEACGRCGHSVCRFSHGHGHSFARHYGYSHAQHHAAPFQVTYNVTFPPPAAAGGTAYAYASALGTLGYGQYNFLDPALYLGEASRYLERSQELSSRAFSEFTQSASLVLESQAAVAQAAGVELKLGVSSGEQRAESREPEKAGAESPQVLASKHAPGPIDQKQILATVTNKCVRCHGPDRQEAKLRLDNFTQNGQPLNAKFLAADGVLAKRLFPEDPKQQMPPPDSGLRLTTSERLALARLLNELGKETK